MCRPKHRSLRLVIRKLSIIELLRRESWKQRMHPIPAGLLWEWEGGWPISHCIKIMDSFGIIRNHVPWWRLLRVWYNDHLSQILGCKTLEESSNRRNQLLQKHLIVAIICAYIQDTYSHVQTIYYTILYEWMCNTAREIGAATQPLCQSGWTSHSYHSVWVAEWLSGWVAVAECLYRFNMRIYICKCMHLHICQCVKCMHGIYIRIIS